MRQETTISYLVWDQYLEAAQDRPEEETWRMRAQEYQRDLQDRLR